jgi:hypothetical protein
MLNFFRDQMIVPGISNLEDVAGRPCNLIIESNPCCSSEDDGHFSVSFRMGILEEGARPTSMPRNKMGIGLTLEQTEIFCEALYNLAERNSRTKGPVEIEFGGDNNAKAFGARALMSNALKQGPALWP